MSTRSYGPEWTLIADPTAPLYVDSSTRGKIHLRWRSSPPQFTRSNVLHHVESYVNTHPIRSTFLDHFQISVMLTISLLNLIISLLNHKISSFIHIICQQTAQENLCPLIWREKKSRPNRQPPRRRSNWAKSLSHFSIIGFFVGQFFDYGRF